MVRLIVENKEISCIQNILQESENAINEYIKESELFTEGILNFVSGDNFRLNEKQK